MEIRKIEADIQVRGEGEETEFVISTAGMDRHGTVISPDGWDLSNFKRNPIMAFQHNTGSTDPDDIIGTWDIRVEGGQLLGKPIYEPEDLNPKADKIRRKVQHGTLRAVSVGFIPREWHWGDEKKGEKRDVLYLDKNELLEVSIVAVPSNPDALKRSYEDLRNDIPQPEEVVERGNSLDIVKARLIVNKLKQIA